MKTVLIAVGAICAGLVVAGDAAAQAGKTQFINIGTAGIGGGYYPTGGYICNLVHKTRKDYGHNIRCTVESTAGSVANLRSLRSGDLEVAISQSDWQYHAYNGTNTFKEAGPDKDLRFIFSMHSDVLQIVGRKDKDIKNFQDLKGKIVNTGNVGSGTEATIYLAMSQYPLKPAEYFGQETKLTSREQASKLCDGAIDAFIYPTGIGTASITEATNTCDSVLADWWDPTIEKFVGSVPYFNPVEIPNGTYRGQERAVKSWGTPATLVTTTRMPEEVIYNLTKAVFENLDEFKRQSSLYVGLTREGMVTSGRTAPYHPGAEKYYREVGLLK